MINSDKLSLFLPNQHSELPTKDALLELTFNPQSGSRTMQDVWDFLNVPNLCQFPFQVTFSFYVKCVPKYLEILFRCRHHFKRSGRSDLCKPVYLGNEIFISFCIH